MKNIILLAVQGAGKGTLGTYLNEKYGYVNISLGELMRKARTEDTERAKVIAECQDKGLLVPFDITLDIIKERLAQPDCNNGYILDGFPRTIEQAQAYDKILEELGKDIGIVINLTIPEDMIYERLTGRRICKNCGKTYNIYNEKLSPKQANICDDCQGELYQRSDDTVDVIKVRIDNYFKQTASLIDYYQNKGILYEVSAVDMDKEFKQVEDILNQIEG